jgi:curli biogenesis system outer membrane secretion channel CsgG
MLSFSRLCRFAVPLILVAQLCSTTLAQNTAPKRRIAVMNFDYGAVPSSLIAGMFGSDQDIGKGVSALLITRLVQDGRYVVVERTALDKVLVEQDFLKSDRADPAAASKVGRILDVDAILIGKITRFGPEHEEKKSGGKAIPFGSPSRGSSAGTAKSKAVVDVTVRVVNPATGGLIAIVTGTGISAEAGTFFYASFHTKQGDFDFSGSLFANTVLGEATRKAVDNAAAQVLDLSNKIPFVKHWFSGLVADVSGSNLILNVGSMDGLKVGDTLRVRRQLRVVRNPLTGMVIEDVSRNVGEATVTETEASSSTAVFSGAEPAAVGDLVDSAP